MGIVRLCRLASLANYNSVHVISYDYFLFFMMPTEGEDFTISSDAVFNDRLHFSSDPVQVTVTLLNDGVEGEPEEDIVLTLRQDLILSPLEAFRVLIHPTIRIAFSDNDGIRCIHAK